MACNDIFRKSMGIILLHLNCNKRKIVICLRHASEESQGNERIAHICTKDDVKVSVDTISFDHVRYCLASSCTSHNEVNIKLMHLLQPAITAEHRCSFQEKFIFLVSLSQRKVIKFLIFMFWFYSFKSCDSEISDCNSISQELCGETRTNFTVRSNSILGNRFEDCFIVKS